MISYVHMKVEFFNRLAGTMNILKARKCLSEPKYLVRLIALIICMGIAFFQLSEFFRKIMYPPISTHYTFKLNDSMKYPSITICRNPPYKTEVFEKYGFTPNTDPHFSSSWMNFNFENYTLDEFFDEATYSFKEVIPFGGFAGYKKNLDVVEFTKLLHGKCFKLTPKNVTSLEYHSGYMLYLTNKKNKQDTAVYASGFHIHVHEPCEMINDFNAQKESFMEYIYLEAGDEITYTLRTSEYGQLPNRENNCSLDTNYSQSKCKEECLQKIITEEIGCSTPWMENENVPRCKNYEETKLIISSYNEYSNSKYEHLCHCPRPCSLTIYIPYVQTRKDIELPNSIFSLHYTSNLVTVMEEVSGYDWNLFLADLGGSLGFLLGLSVLGIIGIIEQIVELCISKKKKKVECKEGDGKDNKKVQIYLNGVKLNDDFGKEMKQGGKY